MKTKNNKIYTFFYDLFNLDTVVWLKAIISNSLNLIIIILIFGLMLGMGQGHVIPIDLFDPQDYLKSAANLLIFHVLMFFLGLLMSFYPTFIYAVLFGRESYLWRMKKYGLIVYKKTKNTKENNFHLYKAEAALRKFLGGSIFLIWAYVILRIYYTDPRGKIVNNTFEQFDPAFGIPKIIFVISFLVFIGFTWYHTLYVRKKQAEFNDSDKKNNKLQNSISLFLYFFIPLLLLVIFNYFLGWSPVIVILEMMVCFVLSLVLVYFRTNRKKYIEDNYQYLNFHRIIGLFVLVLIIAINFSSSFGMYINPVNIILAGLISFYTIIIYSIKIYLYLKNKSESDESKNILYLWPVKNAKTNRGIKLWLNLKHYTFLVLIIVIFAGYNLYHGNSLHELQKVVKRDIDTLHPYGKTQLKDFYSGYISQYEKKYKPIFYAAYGGGLKAQYWNYLLLDTIYQMHKFKNFVAMSGVSGGGMGIGNYTAIKFMGKSAIETKKIISNLKKSNILGIELPWLLFKDYIREMLPNAWIIGNDRSNRTMRYYARTLGDSNMALADSIDFFTVYNQIYEKYGFFPNMIFNSTSTTNKYGVASAIINDTLFPGAINILDFEYENKTLTYLEAISTCNRFPFISPAAYVPGKGHFVDGGAFDNSGITSLISFKKALESCEKKNDSLLIFSDTVKLVSVRNDKMNYLEKLLLNDTFCSEILTKYQLEKAEDFTETKAVLSGGVNLERIPNYLRDMNNTYFEHKFETVYIDLPYFITKNDIEDYFGGKPRDLDTIFKIINKSNDTLATLLNNEGYNIKKWGIIDPPTARILSKPVEKYMGIMMKYPSVQRSISEIY